MQPSFDGVNVSLRGAALARRSEKCTRYILGAIRSEMPRASNRIIVRMKCTGVDAKTTDGDLNYGRGVSYVNSVPECQSHVAGCHYQRRLRRPQKGIHDVWLKRVTKGDRIQGGVKWHRVDSNVDGYQGVVEEPQNSRDGERR